jgi:hypothetical protein
MPKVSTRGKEDELEHGRGEASQHEWVGIMAAVSLNVANNSLIYFLIFKKYLYIERRLNFILYINYL